jgi:5-methyltetrahydrofolate--homocysteine methyltransferase
MVIGAGMTSAIMNPCRPQEMEAVRGANVLAGTDKDCMTWIKTYKDYKPGGAAAPAPVAVTTPGDGAAAAGGRRRGGREARRAAG